MHEITINIHMHTTYSDGSGRHQDIGQAALKGNLDAVIVTDHNVWVNGVEKYYERDGKKALLLVGEEVHDQGRQPQKNHLLVFNAKREVATYADKPQTLINTISRAGGLSFLAHPFDPAAPAINEGDLSWVDWDIDGFTGIELWNAMTEMKSLIKSKLHAVFYAFNPALIARNPFPETIQVWDKLLEIGKPVVAIGGSDAHAFHHRLGPIRRVIFPYEYHFRAINTHLLLEHTLSGDIQTDKDLIYSALLKGHAFIGYDLPARTEGFRFVAHGKDQSAWMGDTVSAKFGVTFMISLPLITECHLLKDGQVIKTWTKRDNCTYITSEPGVYRVEVYIRYRGKKRAWIFSNPIYVTS